MTQIRGNNLTRRTDRNGHSAKAVTDSPTASDAPRQLLDYKNIVVLTDGASRDGSAKTAISLLRYREENVSAVLDRSEAGMTSGDLFGAGGGTPVIASLSESPAADALFIGIAPPGGKLPESWKPILLDALELGIDIVSGLHDFLVNDPELLETSRRTGANLVDVRRNSEKSVASGGGFAEDCLRIHTVGHDCSVGKMVVALEVAKELSKRGEDAQFVATGQTGIMISGDGVPVDCVVSDFINGAVERLVHRHQDHRFLLIEGQGSLAHPSFSGVTAGLLHGASPHGLIMCYEAGREYVKGLDGVPLLPLDRLITLYEGFASARHESKVIGVAVNSRDLSDSAAKEECRRVEQELSLPCCDVYRHGAGVLTDAVQSLQTKVAV